ncbi:phosphatase PAP2 family protein [Isoptericola sp. b490]|uniref:phosphatase PAP2 family protein n=1 Tax=Actinotalea lenta TaxID=3064654 RepID=UPI0027129BDE|nr:phosphatase PAP2 family protein [Isoptericola sp. b490]MDO8119823.1 phosphatase PAP2 family protein [Isoptericola sp. b490]
MSSAPGQTDLQAALPEAGRGPARQPRGGLRELCLLVGVYVAYTVVRSFADSDLSPAQHAAGNLLGIERRLGLDVEAGAIHLLLHSELAAVAASVWYSAAHYIVTPLVLVAIYRHRPHLYAPVRRGLLVATCAALVGFLLMPTAPPRLVGPPFVDVLATTSDYGWWGGHASVPPAMASLTNDLAAFPSMHCGWALWVALATWAATSSTALRVAAWSYAVITAVVVVVTGNHWVLDVLAGWALVAVVTWASLRLAVPHPRADESEPTSSPVETDQVLPAG